MNNCTFFLIFISLMGYASGQKPFLIVLTDIGGDPDDEQSMVRLFHYANEFEIGGIIASAHNNSPNNTLRLRDDLVHELIDQYARCKPNFDTHASGYPDAESLHKVVKRGSNKGGREVPLEKFVGKVFI